MLELAVCSYAKMANAALQLRRAISLIKAEYTAYSSSIDLDCIWAPIEVGCNEVIAIITTIKR
jgi:hypothetical protein